MTGTYVQHISGRLIIREYGMDLSFVKGGRLMFILDPHLASGSLTMDGFHC